jgi:pyrroline-5-carboxylate reductase
LQPAQLDNLHNLFSNYALMKLLFVGGGKMMQAIAGGLMTGNHTPANWHVIEPDAVTRDIVSGIAPGIQTWPAFDDLIPLDGIDVIVLCTKPQTMREAVAPLAARLTSQVVVSIAAGIRVRDLSRWLGGYTAMVRTMPNTPALIHAGITGMYADESVANVQKANAQRLMAAVGTTIWFTEEKYLDTVTAVSGSGPAYVFYFIEALERIAMQMGLQEEDARTFALETFRGASMLAHDSPLPPATLRANVTSKRGTTEAALCVFEARKLQEAFMEGVKAAEARSRELGDELGQQ